MTPADLRQLRCSTTWRRLALPGALISMLAASAAGCFDGSQAEGLPCQSSEDCGPSLSCEDGCCGGDCREAPTMTLPVTTEGTSSSSTSVSTSMVTTLEPTLGTTTSVELCPNGMRDEGEECDDDRDSNCENCLWQDHCGDESFDPEVEACDPTSSVPGLSCADDCSSDTLFAWQKTARINPIGDGLFEEGFGSTPWQVLGGEDNALGSGTYFDGIGGDDPLLKAWPEAELRTRLIAAMRPVEDLAGLDVVIRFEHKYQFNNDNAETDPWTGTNDHGRIFLEAGGDPTPIFPTTVANGSAEFVDCVLDDGSTPKIDEAGDPKSGAFCMAGDAPPFCVPMATLGLVKRVPAEGNRPQSVVVRLPAPDFGEEARLSFRVRYDCANATMATDFPAEDQAWKLFGLQVSLEPPGGG